MPRDPETGKFVAKTPAETPAAAPTSATVGDVVTFTFDDYVTGLPTQGRGVVVAVRDDVLEVAPLAAHTRDVRAEQIGA